MAAFYRFQRVRIVNMGGRPGGTYSRYIGSECVLLEPVETRTEIGGPWLAGWETDLAHPYGDRLCVAESQIEPLRYLPSPEDFASIEGDLPRGPVRDPSLIPEPVAA